MKLVSNISKYPAPSHFLKHPFNSVYGNSVFVLCTFPPLILLPKIHTCFKRRTEEGQVDIHTIGKEIASNSKLVNQ